MRFEWKIDRLVIINGMEKMVKFNYMVCYLNRVMKYTLSLKKLIYKIDETNIENYIKDITYYKVHKKVELYIYF